MKRRQRIVALVLASLLCISLLAGVFAGATSAVDRVQQLGIMQGYDDGSFHEYDAVTRAQMAQIIYAMNTGSADASAYAKKTSSFVDINGHWAAGAIKYCAAKGVITGRTATTFSPEDNVTGYEAAKMLLVNMGYSATQNGFSGTKWKENIQSLGDKLGLFDDVWNSLDEPMTREDIAQMICNALDA